MAGLGPEVFWMLWRLLETQCLQKVFVLSWQCQALSSLTFQKGRSQCLLSPCYALLLLFSHYVVSDSLSTGHKHNMIFPGGLLSCKGPACQCRTWEVNPWVRRIPWRRNGSPLQYSCMENPMDTGAWRAPVWFTGSQRVGYDWSDLASKLTSIWMHYKTLYLYSLPHWCCMFLISQFISFYLACLLTSFCSYSYFYYFLFIFKLWK